ENRGFYRRLGFDGGARSCRSRCDRPRARSRPSRVRLDASLSRARGPFRMEGEIIERVALREPPSRAAEGESRDRHDPRLATRAAGRYGAVWLNTVIPLTLSLKLTPPCTLRRTPSSLAISDGPPAPGSRQVTSRLPV